MTLPVSSIASQASQWTVPKAGGGEWSVGGVGGGPEKAGGAQAAESPAGGFGSMLTNAVGNLEKTQEAAATQSTELATGQTQDISSVITAVQEASLSMELASQVRNKAVEAYTEIFHTQI
ncbi:MAG TPA: flagellar hook-basal body complex protein FliE [Solirubrobacterales bacterium]|jgi:flagellar hook-basal body complex protein FliE|nr:flagellar hook-basal body complex protein FliE [Solirubrobacterales bacterium]